MTKVKAAFGRGRTDENPPNCLTRIVRAEVRRPLSLDDAAVRSPAPSFARTADGTCARLGIIPSLLARSRLFGRASLAEVEIVFSRGRDSDVSRIRASMRRLPIFFASATRLLTAVKVLALLRDHNFIHRLRQDTRHGTSASMSPFLLSLAAGALLTAVLLFVPSDGRRLVREQPLY
ncbi:MULTISPECIES: hypothetical protein [Sphingomonadaceae]|uniref:hypothetical protein n=1 Tax=Sphingomonadales TaxID=204457 RepID=UPI0011A4C8F1|nr:hypothetical protein [Sphingobium sp. TKS]MCF8707847.1 hypothetical protein [Rhizorhapis sp. SPR117]